MKITSIAVYQPDVPLLDPGYQWAKGRRISVADTTVVQVRRTKV